MTAQPLQPERPLPTFIMSLASGCHGATAIARHCWHHCSKGGGPGELAPCGPLGFPSELLVKATAFGTAVSVPGLLWLCCCGARILCVFTFGWAVSLIVELVYWSYRIYFGNPNRLLNPSWRSIIFFTVFQSTVNVLAIAFILDSVFIISKTEFARSLFLL